MNINTFAIPPTARLNEGQHALAVAKQLAESFSLTAVERDHQGGTPKLERDAIRNSGLLSLIIPRQYGGYGANWQETLQVVREFAKVDSSIAHVYGFQHLMLATVRLFSRPDQWERWYEQTAQSNWFWGNALNPLDERTLCKSYDHWHEFSGKKSFCSGAMDSEMLIASAIKKTDGQLVIAAIPTLRTGVTILDDWDNIGQRQTDSGSVNFEKVRVEENELLTEPGPLSNPFACLRPLIAQLILTNIYLGIAEGAFNDAQHYTLREARPWKNANVDITSQDPYILAHYGEFWVGLEATRALTNQAAEKLDIAWAKGLALTEEDRGLLATSISAAKVLATRTGLDITSRMFEVAGSRATHAGLRLDRHWRNLRTHTLHDPLDYKIKELGEWALTGSFPNPTFYS
ncbi:MULTISPECIES: acyl-CoA dehydrogenase family protein [unclassified Methylophilus]|uniref:acyl-CoA dehydrogenase family protein n=1 Tax=unclassified Methylophilus TaxID=2630143 RepID=UPI0003615DDB|nr:MULTISPECIES: acyl-CoA dehydrogenase family protein [unclassified Methylophilus]MBF4989499.1 acyl-CoA dehydrogenase family protein [Methylophilus sp. QUAN]HCU83792.1 monooxygenase [Methylophilus sp.]